MKPLFFSSFYYVLLLTTHFSATPGPARPGPPGDLQRSSVDAGHHAVPEGPGFGAIVVGLHHSGLLARIASLEHDDHASCFDKLAHHRRPAKVFTTLPQTLEPKPWTDDLR